MTDRQKIILAIIGSLVLHVIFILGGGEAVQLWPAIPVAAAKEEHAMPELTLMDTPPPQQSSQKQYIRTNDDQKTEQKPVDSIFESDKDTASASEQAANGQAPIPTQEGKDIPELGFRNESSSLADQGQVFAFDPGRELKQSREAKKEKQQTQAQPAEIPTPRPTPQPTPQPTSTPQEELAMLRATPTPPPNPAPRAVERPQERQSAPATAYRPQQRINRMQGNISTRGRSSIAAVGTPQGRFHKAVEDAIGSRWYRYVRERNDLINIGTVQIRFYVTSDGRVEDAKILNNTSNQTLASCSLRSIIDANIPPMPEELAPLIPEGRLEFTESFSFTY